MTIEKRRYLGNLPLGRTQIVTGVEQFTRLIDSGVLGLSIVDTIEVSGAEDEIRITRIMRRDSDGFGREQRPAILCGYQINEEPVSIKKGFFTTVFSYIDHEIKE